MRMIRTSAILLPILWISLAHAAGNSDAGHQLAQQWCASCHLIEPGGKTSVDSAPSFMTIAGENKGAKWLRTFLNAPHPPMRGIISLSATQTNDIAAYLDTLKGNP